MCPKGGDGMANSVDPYQIANLGAVWSGSTLFAQACLSENLDHYGTGKSQEVQCLIGNCLDTDFSAQMSTLAIRDLSK